MKKIIVTSGHGWHRNRKLEFIIDDGKILEMYLITDKISREIDLTKIDDIDLFFWWLGLGPDELDVDGMDLSCFYNLIYKHRLPKPIKLIREQTCGCNMGNCGAFMGVTVDDDICDTIEDLHRKWGDDQGEPFTWYEYPDSVLISLNDVSSIPNKVYKNSCYQDPVDFDNNKFINNDDYLYVLWGYGR